MSSPDPRLSAHKVICRCLSGPADLQQVLDQELQRVAPARDRALVTEMVYGYLRFRGRIDYAVNLFLNKPDRLPARLKNLLGLAGYELFFLDRVPDYATVSKAVDLSTRLFGPKMSGLVNAVLRRLSGVDIFSEAVFKRDHPEEAVFWSRFYSCPLWLARLWGRTYSPELCLEYLRQSLDKPPLGLRESGRNPGILTDSCCVARRMGNSVLIHGNCPHLEEHLLAGRVFRQSFAGQQAMHELGMNSWKQPVWDMCAGSGGKTLLMLDHGLDIHSSDISLNRLKNLKKLARDCPSRVNIFAACGSAPPLKHHPKTVLIDAPCTGLGVLSRRPDIKWKRSPADLARLVKTQAGLLDGAASVLDSKGRIIYLTCTLSHEENHAQISNFLRRHDGFFLEQTFQTDPGQDLKEFFFGAVLKKK